MDKYKNMKNKEKILIALASFSFFLIVYLVIASKKIEMPTEKIVKEDPVIEKEDLVQLKSSYQETLKNIFIQLSDETENIGTSTEEINVNEELLRIKNVMMSLIVPEEYRSFHLSLIILLDKVIENNFVLDEDFQLAIKEIGQQNLWLN